MPHQRCFLPSLAPSLLLTATMIAMITATTHGAVFLCPDAQGHPTYTDLGCPADTPPAARTKPSPASQFLEFAPLDATETRRLAQLEKRLRDNARDNRRSQNARRAGQQKARADARQRCRAATAALRDLRDQRRKGYSLKEAAALDERDAQLRAERSRACR